MPITRPPTWPMTTAEAMVVQRALSAQVIRSDSLGEVRYVAGLDVGLEANNTRMRAAVAVLDFSTLKLRDYAIARHAVEFPYIPGFLSFREAPVLLDALEQLSVAPDLLVCDGQGLAHPRRFGIACHVGVLADMPCIGVAKSLLVGKYDNLPDTPGAWRPLWHKEEVVGAAMRTRRGVSPIYVSIGHRISLETALGYVASCCTKYRLPETTRFAHRLASGPDPANS